MSYNYNGIATVTGTLNTDFKVDASGVLYILNSIPTVTFNSNIKTPCYYQDTALSGYYGNIFGFVVLVGPGGGGGTLTGPGGGGGGGGGIVIQNNYPFFNNGTYSFGISPYNSSTNYTKLYFTPTSQSKATLYTANGGGTTSTTNGGVGGSCSGGTNIYPATYLTGASGGNGSATLNGSNGVNGILLSNNGVPLNIYCGGGGGGAANSTHVGGNGGLGGGAGGGGGTKGSNSSDYSTSYGGGGGGNTPSYGGNPGTNGVVIIYATNYEYSKNYNVVPPTITTGYKSNGIAIEQIIESYSGNSAPLTNFKYKSNDLNTYFQGYLTGSIGTSNSYITTNLSVNNIDLTSYFKTNLVITSGSAYNYRTSNYNIYYFTGNATFNYSCKSTLYAVIVGGGGGSGGSQYGFGSGGGGGGGICMGSYTNTSTLNLTFTCGAGGAYGSNSTSNGGNGGNSTLSGATPNYVATGGYGSNAASQSEGPGGDAGTLQKITLPSGVYTYGVNSNGTAGVNDNSTPGYPTGFTLQIEDQLFFLSSGGQGGFGGNNESILNIPNNNNKKVFAGQQPIYFNPWGSGFGGEVNIGSSLNGLNGTGSGGGGQRGAGIGTVIGGLKGGSGCCIVFFQDTL
jgi:hypothetical protein